MHRFGWLPYAVSIVRIPSNGWSVPLLWLVLHFLSMFSQGSLKFFGRRFTDKTRLRVNTRRVPLRCALLCQQPRGGTGDRKVTGGVSKILPGSTAVKVCEAVACSGPPRNAAQEAWVGRVGCRSNRRPIPHRRFVEIPNSRLISPPKWPTRATAPAHEGWLWPEVSVTVRGWWRRWHR